MVKFEQKERKKIRKLNSYISEPIRKSLGGFKDKIVSIFKTNTPKKQCMGEGKN